MARSMTTMSTSPISMTTGGHSCKPIKQVLPKHSCTEDLCGTPEKANLLNGMSNF